MLQELDLFLISEEKNDLTQLELYKKLTDEQTSNRAIINISKVCAYQTCLHFIQPKIKIFSTLF